MIRALIYKELPRTGISEIEIERTREDIRVNIKSNKPGLIIGRRGSGIEALSDKVAKAIKKLRRDKNISLGFSLHLDVVEIRRTETSASVVAGQVAGDLERRLPFRTVLKRHLQFIKSNKEVLGAKIKVSGRLNGAEIARTEWLGFGEMPLQTIRANIDYGSAVAYTTYGTIGVDVWIYKGEQFEETKKLTGR